MSFIVNPDISDVQSFFSSNPKGKKFFRYFDNRPFDIIQKHKLTLLLKENNEILGYGHLDVEQNITWLGIMVSDTRVGLGLGKKIMNELLKNCKDTVYLSVDVDNDKGIKLYSKYDFKVIEKINEKKLIMSRIGNFTS